MSWQLSGNVLIACNCDYGCPCNFNALPTHGDCEGGWIWSIDNGTVDGVDLIATTRDGTTVAIPGFHRVGE